MSDAMSVYGGVGALNLRKPFRHEIGLVTTPLDFDPIPNDLARWLGPEFGIAHRNLVVPGYAYRLEDRAKAFPSIAQEAGNLAQLGVDVVGQIGTNWAHCMGWGPEKLRSHCEQVAKAIGIPFHMTGVSILDVLHTFGWRRVAMNNGYYRADWMTGINRFLQAGGVEILYHAGFVDLGVLGRDEASGPSWLCPPISAALASMRAVGDAAPDADAIVLTSIPNWVQDDGTTIRTFTIAGEIETAIGRAIVSSEIALFYSLFKSLGVAPPKGCGTVLDSL